MKPDVLMPEYLKWLPVSDAAKDQLAALGADEPLDLLGMIRAARPEFERLIGVDPLTRVVEALESKTSPEDLASLETPLPWVSLGAAHGPGARSPHHPTVQRLGTRTRPRCGRCQSRRVGRARRPNALRHWNGSCSLSRPAPSRSSRPARRRSLGCCPM